ncbi:hypothetical protein F4819DRAFT_489112 [Hypoxylon fuscum]|nr:hypothetical protein F4819DRAFT_489112 [Hypoxylon fuscum]
MAPMSLITVEKITRDSLPAEIQLMILEVLLQDGCSLASFATVSREWQTIIERHNFARIKLTPSRLADFGSIVHRNRALVEYLWLCLELEEYGCDECGLLCLPWGLNTWDIPIIAAFQDLFSTLSLWEPNGDLLLDIGVHSPSDSKHYFKYLTFKPDTPWDECDQDQCVDQAMLVEVDDRYHHWYAGTQESTPSELAIHRLFEDIMGEGEGAFNDDEQENHWWQKLPAIPAVTGVLLRQQNRRRWKPTSLAQMFARLPRLQEVHYEPWREWNDTDQERTDKSYQSLFESLASNNLRKLVIFENFNQQYSRRFRPDKPIRKPTSAVSQMVANASLKLEHLSASFMVDASYFFHAQSEPSWKWPNLTSLILTSRLLTPNESPTEINKMLQVAAAAAMNMPKLEMMDIWNGREGLATLFRYQSVKDRRPAVITWRGTWEFALQPPVIRAWEAVALGHGGDGSTIVKELLDVDTIKSHGDAIHYLKLSGSVIRPVSLQQIRMEHKIRDGFYAQFF